MAEKTLDPALVSRRQFCRQLAGCMSRCWLGNDAHVRERLEQVLDCQATWVAELAKSLSASFSEIGYANRFALESWLRKQPTIKLFFKGKKSRRLTDEVQRALASRNHRWPVPPLDSDDDLCRLLEIASLRELQWLVLPHVRRNTAVDHYKRTCLKKKLGGYRWIEEPRPKLKAVQRRMLESVLPGIPLHSAAHAYRTGCSVQSCAEPHVGQRVVLKLDLRDYFGTISIFRVKALFANAGYSWPIALRLAQLCTAPARMDDLRDEARSLTRTRLPQGAPTSPSIANAVAYRMDRRLAGLAASVGASYTRYADDLIFSGDDNFAARVDRFATSAAAIVIEEGFAIQFRKTRKLFHGAEQRILGVTVNEKLNLNRRAFEGLKAELHNCARRGWRTQNRTEHADYRAHLRGRIAYAQSLNPTRGAKLLQLFEQVKWNE
ncbi:MAG: RNA-directed DNA polymerase [Pirellulaceae bacterium]|nr:RNA-directed DNA polymerase [Pirellulaceae bacterium]